MLVGAVGTATAIVFAIVVAVILTSGMKSNEEVTDVEGQEEQKTEINLDVDFTGEYSPNVSAILEFGDGEEPYNLVFPSSAYPLLLSESDLRLSTIKFKTYQGRDYRYLSGMQLSFSNGE